MGVELADDVLQLDPDHAAALDTKGAAMLGLAERHDEFQRATCCSPTTW